LAPSAWTSGCPFRPRHQVHKKVCLRPPRWVRRPAPPFWRPAPWPWRLLRPLRCGIRAPPLPDHLGGGVATPREPNAHATCRATRLSDGGCSPGVHTGCTKPRANCRATKWLSDHACSPGVHLGCTKSVINNSICFFCRANLSSSISSEAPSSQKHHNAA
jgi:hypothetical protein